MNIIYDFWFSMLLRIAVITVFISSVVCDYLKIAKNQCFRKKCYCNRLRQGFQLKILHDN